jgi:6-phosphogluconolactonase
MSDFNVFPGTSDLAQAAARQIAELLQDALESRDRASLVLTGGKTPKPVYRALAAQHGKSVDWNRVDFFWGDDRFVPADHDESNVRLAQENLLSRIDASECRTFPFPVTMDSPEDAAIAHEETLRSYFADKEPVFDVLLLGLGEDGHVASLFPGHGSLQERDRWVLHTRAPAGNPITDRLTMTLPIINGARSILFIVAGEKKSGAVAAATCNNEEAPAGLVRRGENVHWFMDEDAAREVNV